MHSKIRFALALLPLLGSVISPARAQSAEPAQAAESKAATRLARPTLFQKLAPVAGNQQRLNYPSATAGGIRFVPTPLTLKRGPNGELIKTRKVAQPMTPRLSPSWRGQTGDDPLDLAPHSYLSGDALPLSHFSHLANPFASLDETVATAPKIRTIYRRVIKKSLPASGKN